MNPETNLLQDLLRRARSRRQLLLSLRGVAISRRRRCRSAVADRLGRTSLSLQRQRAADAAHRRVAHVSSPRSISPCFVHYFKRISDARLARLIEEHSPGTEDRLVTAVEYSNGNARIAHLARDRQSSLPGRKQCFGNARRRQRHPPFAAHAVRRRRARKLADLCRRVEVGTKARSPRASRNSLRQQLSPPRQTR